MHHTQANGWTFSVGYIRDNADLRYSKCINNVTVRMSYSKLKSVSGSVFNLTDLEIL